MEYKQNLHIHSTFCDGADTPEEMVLTAIENGFDSIGFSGHSYMHYSPSYSMSLEGTLDYIKEINRLKPKYAEKIKIFCGLEFDMYSGVDLSPYDYIIGSVHYLEIGGEKIGFDRSAAEVKRVIDTYFGGDGMKYAKAYYETVAKLPDYGKFDIIGHFDTITKHLENADFFDTDSKEYRNSAISALEALKGKIPCFEVNTGAIARGYRTTPYPQPFLLDEFKRLGFKAVISSDCHNRTMLNCGYEDAAELLKQHGFKEIYALTDSGFKPFAL